jgi:hypothetical protein
MGTGTDRRAPPSNPPDRRAAGAPSGSDVRADGSSPSRPANSSASWRCQAALACWASTISRRGSVNSAGSALTPGPGGRLARWGQPQGPPRRNGRPRGPPRRNVRAGCRWVASAVPTMPTVPWPARRASARAQLRGRRRRSRPPPRPQPGRLRRAGEQPVQGPGHMCSDALLGVLDGQPGRADPFGPRLLLRLPCPGERFFGAPALRVADLLAAEGAALELRERVARSATSTWLVRCRRSSSSTYAASSVRRLNSRFSSVASGPRGFGKASVVVFNRGSITKPVLQPGETRSRAVCRPPRKHVNGCCDHQLNCNGVGSQVAPDSRAPLLVRMPTELVAPASRVH